jgi:hypothetical protein
MVLETPMEMEMEVEKRNSKRGTLQKTSGAAREAD